MLCEAREQMRKRDTLKKKSDPRKFAIPCTVKGIEFPHAFCDTGASRNSGGIVRDLEVQIGNALVPVDFHVLDIKLNWNSSVLLGRAFLSTVGAVCNLQTNQLCVTLIDPHVHYNPIPVKKPHTTSRRINDPGIIAACHCGADAQKKSTDAEEEESVDNSPEYWENNCHNPILAVNDAPPETRKDLYDVEYRKKGILVYKFRPLKPEIQHKWKQIHFLQKPVEKELASAESVERTDERRLTSRYRSRSTDPRRNRSMLTSPHRSIDVKNSAEELLTFLEPKNSTGKRKMSMESTEMIRDVQEMWMDTSLMCLRRRSESYWKELQEMSTTTSVFQNMLAHSHKPSKYQRSTPRRDHEIFYGICGEQEKNKEDFQMKLDGVYYPLNDNISWLTTCMEEMRQDIARIQRATDVSRSTSIDRHRLPSINSRLHASIDNHLPASVDDNPPHSHTMKSQPDFHTRE
ncbi:hypothetical protein F2Q68_00025374 [Brassica cretica]|uniref:Aspartic peptidase DDI1-type domain-containing protein n=1 Tax=Brassica cretica TaxID=69181 RepID=A0A8S9I9V2_BRACR|nr:hypothetical protein F2Q68_00025374 [Brassica cretica]